MQDQTGDAYYIAVKQAVDCLSALRRDEEAEEMLTKAIEFVRRKDGADPDPDVWPNMLAAKAMFLVQRGQAEEAVALIQEIGPGKIVCMKNERTRLTILSQFAYVMEESGDLEGALALDRLASNRDAGWNLERSLRQCRKLILDGNKEKAINMYLRPIYHGMREDLKVYQNHGCLVMGERRMNIKLRPMAMLRSLLSEGGEENKAEIADIDATVANLKASEERLRCEALQEVASVLKFQREENGAEKDGEECAICLCVLSGEEEGWEKVVNCGHAFHSACLDAWASKCREKQLSCSCPKCRGPLTREKTH